ncbi:MAG: sigma-54 dependent transcriptional regulator [Candidatus Krumholzibacteria bacterium]|nr:sigma-54 dependent transcriptional regulator [Candidatus Krumholzibacteria bacterium]
MLIRILLLVEDEKTQRRVKNLLRDRDALIGVKKKGENLWQRLAAQSFDVVAAAESELPSPIEDSIAAIRALPGAPDVIVFRTDDDAEIQAGLVAAGAVAVLWTGIHDDTLNATLAALLENRLTTAQLQLKVADSEENRLGDFVSSSPAMHRLMNVARRVVESDTTLLILGETGVGKEWLARSIHAESPRSGNPFIPVNCAAIPEGLVESELFGHRQGAFTGAKHDHRGYFEMAHGGTIFLDEVAEMSQNLQVKLMRILQERTFQRIGSERMIQVDVRVVAATNRNPSEEIETGRLREDLYYRLGVVTLTVPPLRDRKEDIPALVENYFAIFRARLARPISTITPDFMDALVAYGWPGNVRELINVMERAVLLANGDSLTLLDLPDEIGGTSHKSRPAAAGPLSEAREPTAEYFAKPLRQARREAANAFERRYLTHLLAATNGRIAEAAAKAGITPRGLFARMKHHSLRKEDFK